MSFRRYGSQPLPCRQRDLSTSTGPSGPTRRHTEIVRGKMTHPFCTVRRMSTYPKFEQRGAMPAGTAWSDQYGWHARNPPPPSPRPQRRSRWRGWLWPTIFSAVVASLPVGFAFVDPDDPGPVASLVIDALTVVTWAGIGLMFVTALGFVLVSMFDSSPPYPTPSCNAYCRLPPPGTRFWPHGRCDQGHR